MRFENTRRWCGFALFAGLGACGYQATPARFDVMTITDDNRVNTVNVRGLSDPSASTFSDGVLLSSRWSTNQNTVRTVEFFLDINKVDMPSSLERYEPSMVLSHEEQEITVNLTERDREGRVVYVQTPTWAEVTLEALASDGQKNLSAGLFSIEFSALDQGLYAEVHGTWQTIPPPPSVTLETPDFDIPPDYAPSDPTPTIPENEDSAVVADAGCSCPGGTAGEDLPEEDPPEENKEEEEDDTKSSDSGCDCKGDADRSEDKEESEVETDEDTDNSGCDCGGDSNTDKESSEEKEEDKSRDEEDTGCDCSGEGTKDGENDENGFTSSFLAKQGQAHEPLASMPPHKQPTFKKKRRSKKPCRRSRMAIAVELSPLILAYFWTRRRRRNFIR